MIVFDILSILSCKQNKRTHLIWAVPVRKQPYFSGRVSFSLGGGCQFWVSS